MTQQKKRTTDMWSEKFAVNDDDVAFLYDWLLMRGEPCATKDLAIAVVQRRLTEQAERLRAELDKGEPYQPSGTYQPGQVLVFPALDFAVGTVTGMRDGVNPAYSPFKVIQVEIEGEDQIREFPSDLDYPHRLNVNPLGIVEDESAEAIYEEHKEILAPAIESRLKEVAGLGFVRRNGRWFLSELLAEVHIGHLNIAEALIELNNRPVSSEDILRELDLPQEIAPDVRRFSLELAMTNDDRFTNFGTGDEPAWYLSRLVPPQALEKPRQLAYTPISVDDSAINPVLRQIESEIGDELSDLLEPPRRDIKPGDKITLVLIYPHRKAGTLPITAAIRDLLPEQQARTFPLTLTDGRTGEAISAWAVPEEQYLFGLDAWYEKNEIPAGAYITLQGTRTEGELIVDYEPRRMRREWVRIARAEEGSLTFQMTKYPIACEYDEAMLVGVDEDSDVDALWFAEEERNRPILDILMDVFPELAKLNPRVHAKTAYAAFNILRRCPPAPIFYELSVNDCFEDAGNGYWTLDPTKLGKH